MSASCCSFAFHGHAKVPALAVTPNAVGKSSETIHSNDSSRLRRRPCVRPIYHPRQNAVRESADVAPWAHEIGTGRSPSTPQPAR